MGKYILVFVTAVIVVGCGGGSDSSGGSTTTSTASADITAQNAVEIAGATTDAALASAEFDEIVDLGLFGSPATATVVLSGSNASVNLAKKTAQLQATTAAASVEETTECPMGGFMTISAEIQEPETLSTGDSFSLSYMDCDYGEGMVANGSIGFTVSSFSGELGGEQFELGFDLDIDNLQLVELVEDTAIDGDMSMVLSVDATTSTVTISGSSLSLSSGTDSFSLSQYSTSATVDSSMFPTSYTLQSSGFLMSSHFDGEVRFSTSIELQGSGEGNPVDGEFTITGAEGATVTVIPMDEQMVRVELDLDGDDAVDEDGVIDMSWQEFLGTPDQG
jgi:hypothetical protein